VILTGVTVTFSAAHKSPEGQLHGHSYEVTAWFENRNRQDVRCFQASLRTLVSVWDHTTLPDELAWCEDIARAVGILSGVVEVEVRRPLEGLHARWKS
jgi:6-pyruvoyl-tetrahydropterin synthase